MMETNIHISSITRPIFYMGLVILLQLSFGCKTSRNSSKLGAVQYNFSLPMVGPGGVLRFESDSVYIISADDQVLFEIPYEKRIMRPGGTDEEGNEVGIIERSGEFGQRYFFYKKGETYGHYYKSLDAAPGKRVLVDSFLMTTVFGNLDFYNPKYDTLVYSEKINGDKLVERYVPKQKLQGSFGDTMVLYYDRTFTHLSYSLSPKLDSIKKMKLVKAVAVVNPSYDSVSKRQLPGSAFIFAIKPKEISNRKDIIDFLSKAK